MIYMFEIEKIRPLAQSIIDDIQMNAAEWRKDKNTFINDRKKIEIWIANGLTYIDLWKSPLGGGVGFNDKEKKAIFDAMTTWKNDFFHNQSISE